MTLKNVTGTGLDNVNVGTGDGAARRGHPRAQRSRRAGWTDSERRKLRPINLIVF